MVPIQPLALLQIPLLVLQVLNLPIPFLLQMLPLVLRPTAEAIEATDNDDRTENNISIEANSVADEIAKLAKLKADGALSEKEYTKMKNDLIEKM